MRTVQLVSTMVMAAIGVLTGTPGTFRGLFDSEPSRTAFLVNQAGERFSVAADSLRARFCSSDGSGPCYDHPELFVYLDNCMVTAFALSEITYFENTGEFSPTSCIHATETAQLQTEGSSEDRVYVQDHGWFLVGKDVDTGDEVTLPLGELKLLQRS